MAFTTYAKTAIDTLIAAAKNRANHTGTQAASTITGLAAVATSGLKADVGLANVDNTPDAGKPVSTVQQAAINAERDRALLVEALKADLINGKIPTSQIAAISTHETVSVATEAARLALTTSQVQPGDEAIVTSGTSAQKGRWLLLAADPSQTSSWLRLSAPGGVQSVNGQTVPDIVLAPADIQAAAAADLVTEAATARAAEQANATAAASKIPMLPLLATVTAAAALTKTAIQPVNAATAAVTMTALPALSSLNLGDAYGLEKIDATSNPVTVPFSGTDATLSGSTSMALTMRGTAVIVVVANPAGGRVWRVVDHVRADNVVASAAALAAATTRWSDEFLGSTLDLTKWHREGSAAGGYGIETFDNSAALTQLNGSGQLVVKATKDGSGNWHGGMVTTRDSLTFTQGTIEIRAKLPTANGAWPALWLINDVDGSHGPLKGEIDIMELFPGGGSNGPGCYFTVHDWTSNPTVGANKPPNVTAADGNWHVWRLVLKTNSMELFIDGVSQGSFVRGVDLTVWPWSDTPMFVVFNMSVGGKYTGAVLPDAGTTELAMQVDYIRYDPLPSYATHEEIADARAALALLAANPVAPPPHIAGAQLASDYANGTATYATVPLTLGNFASQTRPSTGSSKVAFTSTSQYASATASATGVQALVAGTYLVTAMGRFSSGSAGNRGLIVQRNGAQILDNGFNSTSGKVNIADTVTLAAGDVVSLAVYIEASGVTVNGYAATWLKLTYLGPAA